MSTHKEYALIAILAMAAVVGVIPAFAADNPYLACPDCNDTSSNIQSPPIPITVTTDKTIYDHSSVIMVSGHVKNPYPGQDVAMKVISPSGNVVGAAQLTLDSNGDFATKVDTASTLMAENGQYTIYVQQGDEQARTNQVAFQLAGETPVIPEFGPYLQLQSYQ
ncbi:MAG: hypothetical protein E6K87_06675 [Thaumarchaeota archaeon]|nr:MAG: hypothetical protein E6K87_06675 [Nitrososphaerota archaeon]